MVVAKEWGGENEELLFNGHRVTFLQEKELWRVDSGDGCTII